MKLWHRIVLSPVINIAIAVFFTLAGIGLLSNMNKIIQAQVEVGIAQAFEQATKEGKKSAQSK